MNRMGISYSKTKYGFVDEYVNIDTNKYHVNYNIGNSKIHDELFDAKTEADDRFFELCEELEELTDYLED